MVCPATLQRLAVEDEELAAGGQMFREASKLASTVFALATRP